MESTEEREISLIITEDGQYNVVDVNQSSAEHLAELSDATEVYLQQEDSGVEVMYIVQPETNDVGVTYEVEGVPNAENVSFADVNGMVIQTSQPVASGSGDGRETQVMTYVENASEEIPDDAGDRQKETLEDDVNILLFCQYCGENLVTLDDLKAHLKEVHDVDDEIQPDSGNADGIQSLFPTCSNCGSTFLDEEDLKAHSIKCDPDYLVSEPDGVLEVKPVLPDPTSQGHKCQLCHRVFHVRSDLDLHIEEEHLDPVEEARPMTAGGVASMYHECPYCQRLYMSKWHKKSLIKHIKDEHPDQPWNVPFKLVEKENIGMIRRLNAKKGGNPGCYTCIYCNTKFWWQKSLARHYKETHQDEMECLEEHEVTEILGKKQSRTVAVFGDEANFPCFKCGRQFLWEKTFKRHSLDCKGPIKESGIVEDFMPMVARNPLRRKSHTQQGKSHTSLLKCLFCSLVSKYTCSMRKHIKRFHRKEVAGMDINKLDIPIVDMETHAHNVITVDKRPADIRLKDCPVVFKCKFCDYASSGQSNLKRHLMSIKHNFTEGQLAMMKLSSFKVFHKDTPLSSKRTRGRPKKGQKQVSDDEKKDDLNELSQNQEHSSVKDTDETCLDEEENNEVLKTDGTVGTNLTTETMPQEQTSHVILTKKCEELKVSGSPQAESNNYNKPTKQQETQLATIKVVTPTKTSSNKKITKCQDKQLLVVEDTEKTISVTCPICSTSFEEFSSFKEHCKAHVNIKVDFNCPLCEGIFPMFASLEKHFTTAHPSQQLNSSRLQCMSAKEVKSKQSKVKAFECPYCDLILSQSRPLIQHVSQKHIKHCLSITVKTESLQSMVKDVISGLSCGFCECVYSSIEEMVNHMQIIHPFVDKSTLGQGTSDSGSVRKSGRKRKINYPWFDEEDSSISTTKKQKLNFKSPVSSRKGKNEQLEETPIDNADFETNESPVPSRLKLPKKSGKGGNQKKVDNDTKSELEQESQKEKIADNLFQWEETGQVPSPSVKKLKPLNIQPTVNLGKKVEADTPKTPEKSSVQKKRGRKRKEDKVEILEESSDIIVSNRSYSDGSDGNKCPHCNFSCKRSSALTFHINFNHLKIKEEPIDPDLDVYTTTSTGNTPKGKRNIAGAQRQSHPESGEQIEYVHMPAKKLTKSGVSLQKSNETSKTGDHPPVAIENDKLAGIDNYDLDDEEDLAMMDDSDADQDYKPTGKDDDEEDDEEFGDDDDDFADIAFQEISSKRYKCTFCEDTHFKSARVLERHVKKEHPDKVGTYSVEACEEPGDIQSTTVPGISHLHKCVYCNKQYNSKESVINHVKAVHKDAIASKVQRKSGHSAKPVIVKVKVEDAGLNEQKSKSKFKCSICNFLCQTHNGLKKHMLRCHRGSGISRNFITTLDMNSDDRMSNSYQCPYCRFKTYYKSCIKRHVNRVHHDLSENFDVDSACGIVTDEARERERREKVPQNGHFSCPYCGIINKWKKSIIRHIKVAHPEEDCDVEILPVDHPEIKAVKENERLCTGFKKSLQCLHCTFSCKRFTQMTSHLRMVHDVMENGNKHWDGEANYQYVYEKQVPMGSQGGYMDVGPGGLYKCPYCSLTYGWKKSLYLHVRRNHSKDLDVFETMDKLLTIVADNAGDQGRGKHDVGNRCDQCGTVFRSSLALIRHNILKHGIRKRNGLGIHSKRPLPRYVTLWRQKNSRLDGRYRSLVCKQCRKLCTSLLSLRVHTLIHHRAPMVECLFAECDASFLWNGTRKIHERMSHQHYMTRDTEKYKCELCNKLFNSGCHLSSHIRQSHLQKKVKRNKFVYRCSACEMTFDSANIREQHFATSHIELTEMCELCGGVFSNKKKLERHIKKHENHPVDSTTICDHCGLTMIQKSLKKHLLFKHTEKLVCDCAICSDDMSVSSVHCDLCNKSFCQKIYLYAHKRMQHANVKDRMYSCKLCTQSFPSQKLRNVHLHEQHLVAKLPKEPEEPVEGVMDVWTSEEDKDRTTHVIHVGQDKGAQYLPKLSESSLSAVIKELVIISTDKNSRKPLKCLLCGRSFAKSKYIKLHIRRSHVKDEDKPYRCKVCGSGFVRLTEFRKHSRSHSGFRPYKCRICMKAFKQQANLTDHMHIHKESKDFQCFICKRHFQQRGGMTSHILTHDTLKPFKCMYCEKGFTSRGELSRHMQKYSSQMADSKTFLCHICQTSFPHYPLLIRHIDTHNPDKPFSCEACAAKFGSYMSLYNHKLKQKHFLLTDIQLGEEIVEPLVEKTRTDTQAAVASLEEDLYAKDESVQETPVEETETVYISQDGYVNENPDEARTTIIIEPMDAEEVVQTSSKIHDNEELLSIAKQLTELSSYTENDTIIEFSVINDENEIMKDMLDADNDVLASIEKQNLRQRQAETHHRKMPETIEEILQIQQIEHNGQEETLIVEEQEMAGGEIIEEQILENESSEHQVVGINETVTTTGEVTTNMGELAALIAQNTMGVQSGEGITAYETEDGIIYVCMPENVDSQAYEEVLNTAVQSISSANMEIQETTETQLADSNDNNRPQDDVSEVPYTENQGDAPVIHVNINQVPESARTGEETFIKLPVNDTAVEQSNIDILGNETLNLYEDSVHGVVEIENDEKTFIKQELLDDTYNMTNGKFTLENGIFSHQTTKLRYEIKERNFKCLECGKCSVSKKRLKDHMKRHLPVESRENACMYCSRRFVTANELARHLVIHTDDRRFKCNHCHKSFRQPGHLTEHLLIHQNLRPHKCNQCFQCFRTKRQLITHKERRHDSTKFKCDECDAQFTSKIGLFVHKGSIHSTNYQSSRKTGRGPVVDEGGEYQCDKCGSAFSTGLRLKKHLKTHEDKSKYESKNFMCEVCGVMYHSKDYLRNHIANLHSEEAAEMCDICGQTFKTSRLLAVHKRRDHPGPKTKESKEKRFHPCRGCHKRFSTRHALAYHIGATPACRDIKVDINPFQDNKF